MTSLSDITVRSFVGDLRADGGNDERRNLGTFTAIDSSRTFREVIDLGLHKNYLDRKVYGDANLHYSITTEMKDPKLAFPGDVILELKFTNRFPDWFRELVRIFGVMQCGAAKYCECVQAIGYKKLNAVGPVLSEPVGIGRTW